jgi:hypothetical protein
LEKDKTVRDGDTRFTKAKKKLPLSILRNEKKLSQPFFFFFSSRRRKENQD